MSWIIIQRWVSVLSLSCPITGQTRDKEDRTEGEGVVRSSTNVTHSLVLPSEHPLYLFIK